MENDILKYSVQHPLLKNCIKFFWELRIENAQLNHKIIPQRNINLRFNLSETPHYASINDKEHLLEDAYFLGLHDHFRNTNLKITGKVDVFGVCFYPDGFYPFLKMPVSEFKNQLLGVDEVSFKLGIEICERLKEAQSISERLKIIESEFVLLLNNRTHIDENFRSIFNTLINKEKATSIYEFCLHNNICIRKLERMYKKYVGVSANTYNILNRFHTSMNQILYRNYTKLSDLAYDNGYFDQMHFIKDFKRFAGNTPRNFVEQNNSILQLGKIRIS